MLVSRVVFAQIILLPSPLQFFCYKSIIRLVYIVFYTFFLHDAFSYVMSSIGTVFILVLVSMVIHSSSANEIMKRCEYNSPYSPSCMRCCRLATRQCRLRCRRCIVPSFAPAGDKCFMHKDNSNYMLYFRSKGCPFECGLPRNYGRELGNDVPYFFAKMQPDHTAFIEN